MYIYNIIIVYIFAFTSDFTCKALKITVITVTVTLLTRITNEKPSHSI